MNTESFLVGSQEHLLEIGQKELCQVSKVPLDLLAGECQTLPHLPASLLQPRRNTMLIPSIFKRIQLNPSLTS